MNNTEDTLKRQTLILNTEIDAATLRKVKAQAAMRGLTLKKLLNEILSGATRNKTAESPELERTA